MVSDFITRHDIAERVFQAAASVCPVEMIQTNECRKIYIHPKDHLSPKVREQFLSSLCGQMADATMVGDHMHLSLYGLTFTIRVEEIKNDFLNPLVTLSYSPVNNQDN